MGISSLFTQSVQVSTYSAGDSFGSTYAEPVTVSCFVNDRRELARNTDGSEVVSETTLYVPLADVDLFTVGSRVVVNTRTMQVLSAYRRDSAGPSSTWHAQITLT